MGPRIRGLAQVKLRRTSKGFLPTRKQLTARAPKVLRAWLRSVCLVVLEVADVNTEHLGDAPKSLVSDALAPPLNTNDHVSADPGLKTQGFLS